MSLKRLLILVATAMFAACAFAQAANDSSAAEEMILGTSSPDLLLMRGDVRDDLQLSTDQSIKILTIQNSFQDESSKLPNSSNPDEPQEPDNSYEALRKYTIDQVDQVLTAEQLKRLKQIALQLTGYSALAREDLQKQIDLSKDLQIKIYDLTNEEHHANDSVMQKYEQGDITAAQVPEIIKKNHQVLNDEIAKILPENIKEKFKALCGKPFKPSTTL